MKQQRATLWSDLVERVSQYGERSSIHGVNYTLDRALAWLDRALWLLLLTAALALAGFMVWRTLADWQDRQVVTTLKTITKPVEGEGCKM